LKPAKLTVQFSFVRFGINHGFFAVVKLDHSDRFDRFVIRALDSLKAGSVAFALCNSDLDCDGRSAGSDEIEQAFGREPRVRVLGGFVKHHGFQGGL